MSLALDRRAVPTRTALRTRRPQLARRAMSGFSSGLLSGAAVWLAFVTVLTAMAGNSAATVLATVMAALPLGVLSLALALLMSWPLCAGLLARRRSDPLPAMAACAAIAFAMGFAGQSHLFGLATPVDAASSGLPGQELMLEGHLTGRGWILAAVGAMPLALCGAMSGLAGWSRLLERR